jgi:FkbM family methyltransferase
MKITTGATITHRGEDIEIEGVHDSDIMIRRMRRWGCFYELDLLQRIEEENLTGTYIDVGANIGNHSIYFDRFCSADRVVSVEAHPVICKVLRRNLRKNMRGKYNTHNWAVVENPGEVYLSPINEDNVGSTHIAVNGVTAVKGHTLNELLRRYPETTLVKMDIEGMELPAIRPAIDRLAEMGPVLTTEFSSRRNRREFEECCKILTKIGYKITGQYCTIPTYVWVK